MEYLTHEPVPPNEMKEISEKFLKKKRDEKG
jgi:hypothetical protein